MRDQGAKWEQGANTWGCVSSPTKNPETSIFDYNAYQVPASNIMLLLLIVIMKVFCPIPGKWQALPTDYQYCLPVTSYQVSTMLVMSGILMLLPYSTTRCL